MKNNLRLIIALVCLMATVGLVTGCTSSKATDTGDKSQVYGHALSPSDQAAMKAGIAKTQAIQAANMAKAANHAPNGAPPAGTSGQ